MTKVTNTVQSIDSKQAQIWLEKRYKNQRPVNHRHVDRLASAMNDGTFSPVSVIMFSVVGDEMHLINGQQTLSAIVKSEKPQTLPVMFYEVPDESEEAKLYFRIDRQRRRSFADSVRATDLCGETNMTPTMIKITAGSLKFAKGNFGTKNQYGEAVSDDDLLRWVQEWAWETKAIYNTITPCGKEDRGLVLTIPVFSVALITMRYQPSKAREFWRQIAQGDGLERNDPRKTLRDWLLRVKGQINRASLGIPKYALSRCCILAWNNWFDDREMKSMTSRPKLGPVKILGTSYSGAQGEDFLPIYPSPNIEQARLTL